MKSCWEILGIEKTQNKLDIKRAYATLAHTISPEDDPEGFQKIHEAYKQALMYADTGDIVFSDLTSDETENEVVRKSDGDSDLPFDYSSVIDPNEALPSGAKYWTECIADFKSDYGIETPQDVLKWKLRTLMIHAKTLFHLYENLYNCSNDKAVWDAYFDEPLIRHLILFHYLDFVAFLREAVEGNSDEGKIITDCFDEHSKTLNLEREKANTEQKALKKANDKRMAILFAIDIVIIFAFWGMFLLWPFYEKLFALFMGIQVLLAQSAIYCSLYIVYLDRKFNNPNNEREAQWNILTSTYFLEGIIAFGLANLLYFIISFTMAKDFDVINLLLSIVFTLVNAACAVFFILKLKKMTK